jgi:hypothetical protein
MPPYRLLSQRILLLAQTHEVAGVDPLALQELDVVDRARAEGDVVQAAVLPVVFELRRSDRVAVGGAAPDDPADVDVAEDLQLRRPRVHPADVRAQRRVQSARVVGVVEVVDAVGVLAERRVVACRRQRERRAAAPAADELGRQQLPVLCGARVVAQEPVEGGDMGVVLAKHDVGPVAAEHLGGRHG